MKKLIIINGTMGVGKSTISKALNQKLHNSVWLDGDWCWMMNPWRFTDENKAMVLDNICHILNNYIRNQSFEYIIFSWVIPSDAVMKMVLDKLDTNKTEVLKFSLICNEKTLISRMEADKRTEEGKTMSLSRLKTYASMDTIKIDTSEKSIVEITSIIAEKIGCL